MIMNADSFSLAFCDHATAALFTASSCGGVKTICAFMNIEVYEISKTVDLQDQTTQDWVAGTLCM